MKNQQAELTDPQISGKESYRILLVENDRYVAEMIMTVLGIMQLHADHAHNADTLAELILKRPYNLVIIDVNLGNENGLELIPRIRQQQPDISFITMTGDNPKSIETRIRELQVIYHLVKPFSINELRSVLRHTINRSSTKSILFS